MRLVIYAPAPCKCLNKSGGQKYNINVESIGDEIQAMVITCQDCGAELRTPQNQIETVLVNGAY